jgi:hypothetical protein
MGSERPPFRGGFEGVGERSPPVVIVAPGAAEGRDRKRKGRAGRPGRWVSCSSQSRLIVIVVVPRRFCGLDTSRD